MRLIAKTNDARVQMKFPTAKEIRKAIADWENKKWEFKDGRAVGDPQQHKGTELEEKDSEMCRDIASFANAGGGYIVIGVQDIRKGGKILGYRIPDRVKNRMGNIVRARVDSGIMYDVAAIRMARKYVTVIAIDEGEGDICTVNGMVYIRGIAGKEPAKGADITRIVRRRLGKKYGPSPTQKEIDTSPYNFPRMGQRQEALIRDFKMLACKLG
jgi:predicted HTH transcriptional regulator